MTDQTSTCDAKMRPFPNDTEIACGLEVGHHHLHRGKLLDYAYTGSVTVMQWSESDRRTYHGDWPGACSDIRCRLPLGHQGNHA